MSQQLSVLRRARLVTDRREGNRRYYRANPDGLAALRRYVESLWDDVLAAYAADDPRPPRQGARK
jgi:DNA-binding transcriptional ArsR family regulator